MADKLVLAEELYSLLGLKQPFSKKEFLTKYRHILLDHHPDKSTNEEDRVLKESKAKRLNELKTRVIAMFEYFSVAEDKSINIFQYPQAVIPYHDQLSFSQQITNMKTILGEVFKLEQPITKSELIKRFTTVQLLYSGDDLQHITDYYLLMMGLFIKFNIPDEEKVMLLEFKFLFERQLGPYLGKSIYYSATALDSILKVVLTVPGIIGLGLLYYYKIR